MLKIRDEAFQYFFYFMEERMNIFWKKLEVDNEFSLNQFSLGPNKKLSNDPIFQMHKFTNVYRALDRVSQYLIKNVIYGKEFDELDTLFRILFFKIFNKIETWEYLEDALGEISLRSFDIDRIGKLLDERRSETPIFNCAYIMAGSHKKYKSINKKHEVWLRVIGDFFIKGKYLEKVLELSSLEELYNLLLSVPLVGQFLAYQYAIDLNYSPHVNFDENSFVKAGIGAIRGIKKCFVDLGKNSFEDAIIFTHENLLQLQKQFGYTEFKSLYGRMPTLIDLQNCFCETDKYLRVKLPEISVGNKRIKQKYKYLYKGSKDLFFPPKWELNR
jgi:hypothetical protein